MLMAQRQDFIEPREGVCYYVMLAEPNREMTAQANLVIRHVPFYLPTIFRAAHLPARQQKLGIPRPDVPVALFPGILFIAEDVVAKSLDLIRNAPGMRSQPFMRFGEQDAVLRPVGIHVVQAIEAGERERYFRRKRRFGAPAWMPSVGDEVRFLLDEVLGGTVGKVSRVDDKGRITLLTEILKRTVRVHATANQIEPV